MGTGPAMAAGAYPGNAATGWLNGKARCGATAMGNGAGTGIMRGAAGPIAGAMGGMTGKGMGRTHVGVAMGGIAGNGIGLAARVGATGMGWTLGIEGGGMIGGIWGMPATGKTGIA
jgi:hypothetical protein